MNHVHVVLHLLLVITCWPVIVRKLLIFFMKHERTGIESSNLVAQMSNLPYIITCNNFKIIYNIHVHVCRSFNSMPDAGAYGNSSIAHILNMKLFDV